MDKKIIFSSGISVLITALIILGGGKITDDDLYGCEARGIVMPCESLSKYYGLPNGKCYNSELGNKLCRSGWDKDFIVEDETKEEVTPSQEFTIAYVNNCNTGNTDKYICRVATGECQSTQEILSELG